ncbi:MAG: hypothetical protein A3J40_09130 [Erythrobacter sp. RIFCSPHIGHO2_12_FULL_63_10]|nr:MAG: hypothetical protein A3J40_09130 [Erythrobacter sp. RIFCSPHIGHO2_12_FULL_63_10]
MRQHGRARLGSLDCIKHRQHQGLAITLALMLGHDCDRPHHQQWVTAPVRVGQRNRPSLDRADQQIVLV